MVQCGAAARPAITRRSLRSGTCDGVDVAVGSYYAHHRVINLRNEEISGGVHEDVPWTIDASLRSRTAVTRGRCGASTSHGGDDPACHFTDAICIGFGDVNVARGIH